jgi:hypothetical protein
MNKVNYRDQNWPGQNIENKKDSISIYRMNSIVKMILKRIQISF